MIASKRGRPRSEAGRKSILDAANALVAERGFKATTLEAIAERAGVSKVTIYRWWPSKAAVVLEAFLSLSKPGPHRAPESSPLAELREQMKTFCRVTAEKPVSKLACLIAEGVFDKDVSADLIQHWIAPRRVDAMRLLKDAIAAGEMRSDVDLEATLDALFGPLYHRLVVRRVQPTPDFATEIWRIVTDGLRT